MCKVRIIQSEKHHSIDVTSHIMFIYDKNDIETYKVIFSVRDV